MDVRYYELNGAPVEDDGCIPKRYVNGAPVLYYDIERFVHSANPISKEQFDAMVAEQKAKARRE